MKDKSLVVAGFLAILLICSCSTPENIFPNPVETDQEPLMGLNVCSSGDDATNVVGWYAYEKGIFEKYGLDVELHLIKGGSNSAAALIAGEMDFCQMAGSAVVNAVISGEDLVFVGGLFNEFLYSLMVVPDIDEPADLKGKALAVTSPGGLTDAATRYALGYMGLDPDKDVTMLSAGLEPVRMAALETGEVHGTVMGLPTITYAQQQGFNELLNLSELDQPYQRLGIVTTREFIDENEDVVERFMMAITESVSKIKKDQDGTRAVMARYMLLDEDEHKQTLDDVYEGLVDQYIEMTPYPTLEGIRFDLERLELENPNAAKFLAEDMVDLRFVEALEKNGFINSLYE